MGVFETTTIGLIRFYQRHSRGLAMITLGQPSCCRFEPTCSEYALQAIARYGIFKGVFMGAVRILRCNPLVPGGFDPVK